MSSSRGLAQQGQVNSFAPIRRAYPGRYSMPGRTPTSLPRSIVAIIVAALVLVACRPVPPTAKEPAPAQPAAAPASGGAPSAAEAPKPAAAAPAAAPATNDGQVKTGGVAVIATREDPPANWDPMFQTSISLAYVGISVF